MKSLAIAVAVMLLCPRAAQDEEPSIEEELIKLVAKVNAHDSFRLRYSGTGDDGREREALLEIAYRAPDAMSVRVEGLQEGFGMLYHGFDLFLQTPDEGCKWAHSRRSTAADLFEELFPTSGAIEPGLILNMHVGSEGFQLSASFSQLGRRAVLGYFTDMIAHSKDVVREDGRLVWKEDGLTLTISRETGFPEAIDISYEDREMDLRLEEIDHEVSIERPQESAKNEELQAFFDRFAGPRVVRTAAFTRLALQLEEGMRELDETTRREFKTFLEALHAEWIEHRAGEWPLQVRDNIDALTARARDADDRAAIEAEARSGREELVAKFHQAFAEHQEAVNELGGSDLPDELLDLEREVIEHVHAERLSGPILAYFDAQLEAALGD